MPFPAILMALANLAPAVLPLFTKNETAHKAAETVSSVAKVLTGQATEENALKALQSDPKLLLEYQHQMNAQAAVIFEQETRRLEAVNATYRAELASGDPYVRRARPTFIYSMAASWTVQMGAASVLIVWKPEHAGAVIAALVSLQAMWATALAVVGVAVHSRSKDKQVAAGQTPVGIIAGMFGKN